MHNALRASRGCMQRQAVAFMHMHACKHTDTKQRHRRACTTSSTCTAACCSLSVLLSTPLGVNDVTGSSGGSDPQASASRCVYAGGSNRQLQRQEAVEAGCKREAVHCAVRVNVAHKTCTCRSPTHVCPWAHSPLAPHHIGRPAIRAQHICLAAQERVRVCQCRLRPVPST